MRSAVREFCKKNQSCQRFVELEGWKRSKIYQKFFEFVKIECDDNFDGFLMGLIFLSNNRRVEKLRNIIINFLCEGTFV
jgi:hypothetical protein